MSQDVSQDSTSSIKTNSFNKGMVKDIDEIFTADGTWFHALNAINNTTEGNLGTLSNEASNYLCVVVPNTIIGTIHLYAEKWVIYSAGNGNSEIGVFDEKLCTYSTTVSDPCLNFSPLHLIKGVAKENFDCTWQVYWADGNNPDRTMTVERPPFIQLCTDEVGNTKLDNQPPSSPLYPVGCITCVNTPSLDCEALRLSKILTTPCLSVSKGPIGGNLLNGSYYVVVAYVLNSQRVTDYFIPSNVQSLFDHNNPSGSLDVTISRMEIDLFNEFELVLVRTINQQTSAKRIGIYSTRLNSINIDYVNEALVDVPIEFIPLRSPSYEKSEAIYETGNYMIRVGPTAKFDFNYQPLSNQIGIKWVAAKYPVDYYRKGGNVTSYMRDEQYCFWIRWVYNTGEKSSSYHIPGRPPLPTDTIQAVVNEDNIEVLYEGFNATDVQNWQVNNTATFVPASGTLPDGGVIVGEGTMGYWESTERYPDDKPDIWNASSHPWSDPGVLDFDLCGKAIRHHKMPDNQIINHFTTNTIVGPDGPYDIIDGIVLLGVQFDNIKYPRDNNGVPIPGIVGYEILRGSREGNKTVVAKGILNNMRKYQIYDEGNTEPGNVKVGLFQNYPYNPCFTPFGAGDSLRQDWFLATGFAPTGVPGGPNPQPGGVNPLAPSYFQPLNFFNQDPTDPGAGISQRYFTFHSPDTQFKNPFLSIKELKTYGEVHGRIKGNFSDVPGHPKEKLLTDAAFMLAAMAGLAAAALSIKGQKSYVRRTVQNSNIGQAPAVGTVVGLETPSDFGVSGTIATALSKVTSGAADILGSNFFWIPIDIFTNAGGFAEDVIMPIASLASGGSPGVNAYGEDRTIQGSPFTYMDPLLKFFSGLAMVTYYFTIGTDAALQLIKAIVPSQQFALRYLSSGALSTFNIGNAVAGNRRRFLNDSMYIDNQIEQFSSGKTVNNLFRGRAVSLETSHLLQFTATNDNTVQTLATARINSVVGDVKAPDIWTVDPTGQTTYLFPHVAFNTTACSYYTATKLRIRNQYGQVDSPNEIPISYCSTLIYDVDDPTLPPNVPPLTPPYAEPFTSPVLFGGDTYVGRYTEKNTMFFFYDWLYGQPDLYEFNYKLHYMVNYPAYWADFQQFETGDFVSSFLANPANPTTWVVPSTKYHLDHYYNGSTVPFLNSFAEILFGVKNHYMYLFNSGVREFMVESEINIDLRDWGDNDEERFYDPYAFTSLTTLFSPAIIKSGNFYKYDFSLSISRIFNNFTSWGNMQDRDYNPLISSSCFTSYPNRLIYSLPSNLESKKDYWQVFLVNNYKDFKARVTAIKPVNKNGALILFETESPIQFQGVDTLETELGTKVTIGDGGLFSQPLQNMVNTDSSYEYGSCQDRLSIINTPSGLYWMSQNQGKIFNYSGQLNDISGLGLRWWFNQFLPFKILEDFPDFALLNNPVAGVGCQSVYDNKYQMVYFCKRDFKLRPQFKGLVSYVGDDQFATNNLGFTLGDPVYFEDASWTISFDPKDNTWISYHDWHPDLLIPSKTSFLSTNHYVDPGTGNTLGGIWRHNDRVDDYGNYYGVYYPFLIDFVQATQQTVNSMRSIEYLMEAFVYNGNQLDLFQLLDFNFDHAIIYNSEQVSGTLIMNLEPKNNPFATIGYPIINPTTIDILYSKEEQKYRFNQFWDVTDDRGEFTGVQRVIWNTGADGYHRTLNPNNLNYAKPPMQRKKFRHYANHILLYRNVSGNVNILLHLVNTKLLYSPR